MKSIIQNRKKFTLVILFVMVITGRLLAQTSSNPDAVIGNFKGPDGDRTMEIYKNNGQYFGKLTAVSENKEDIKAGTVVLKNFMFRKGKWEGKVFVPAKHTDFDATLALDGNNSLVIRVKLGMLSRSKTWSRIQ